MILRSLIIAALLAASPLYAADVGGLTIGGPTTGFRIGNPTFSNILIDASGEKIAFVTQVRGVEPIEKIGVRYGARTGTPPTYKIGLQGVDATGLPDGSFLNDGGGEASITFTPPADTTWDGIWKEFTLTDAYTPALGQYVAIVIEYSSGTIDASNRSSFSETVTTLGDPGFQQSPYSLTHNGAAWSKTVIAGRQLPFTLVTANTVFGRPIQDSPAPTNLTVDGHRQALKFTLPAGAADTFKILSSRMNLSVATGGTFKIGIWSASGTIAETTIDSDYVSGSGSLRVQEMFWDDAATALTAGTTYYVGVERSGTNIGLHTQHIGVANNLKAHPGGSSFVFSSYDGSSWTDDTTLRPEVEITLDDITEPAGGGGASFPNMLRGGPVQ